MRNITAPTSLPPAGLQPFGTAPAPLALVLRFLAMLLVAGTLLGLRDAAAQTAPAKPRSVDQDVTLTLTKAVPLELSVDVRDVLVANAEVAEVVVKTPRLVYLIGLAVGDTNAFLLDQNGNQVMRLNIHVEMDVGALRTTLRNLLPGADIQVDAVNSNIVLSGDVPSAAMAEDARLIARRFVAEDENLVTLLRVTGSQQVVIRVRVAEMRRDVVKQLGVRLLARGGGGSDGIMGAFAPNLGVSGSRLWIPESELIGDPSLGSGGAIQFFVGNAGVDDLLATIDALERDGAAKTLAEPNLTSVSGEAANFLAGGEFPVPTQGEDARVTVQFRPFGIGLAFTPVVLSSGLISMKISTEVSALSNEGAIRINDLVVPALSVRRADTTVEIPSGGSLILAGLLRDDITESINGIPGLSDIPILGALFRSSSFQRKETELVIVATPYLVNPVAPDKLVLPTDGYVPPSDLDFFLLGRLYSRYPAVAGEQPPATAQPVGYVME